MSDKRFAMLATDALHSRKIDHLSVLAEAVYYRLHMATDKFGTMPGAIDDVMSRAFSRRQHVTDADVADALDELEAARLVERWVEDGSEWLYLTGFDDHSTSEFKRKRKRYYPVPPSEREDPFRPGSDIVPQRSDRVPTLVEGRGESPLTGPAPAPLDDADLWRRQLNALRDRQINQAEFLELVRDTIGSARSEPSADEDSGGGEPLDTVRRDLPRGGSSPHPAPSGDSTPRTPDQLAAELERVFHPTAPQSASDRDGNQTDRGAA